MGKKIKLKTQEPLNFSYNATVLIPILIDTFDKKPFQLSVSSLVMNFDDFSYCRKDPGRKSSKKNCMGSLDSLFQDIFSCRLFGTYIHPKFCGPKKSCFVDSTINSMSKIELINTPKVITVEKQKGKIKESVLGKTKRRVKSKRKSSKLNNFRMSKRAKNKKLKQYI